MGDAIQRLLDEARPVVARWEQEGDSWSWTMGWIVEMVDTIEAAQRPSVSPEVREALARVVREATAEYFREDLPEDGRDETDTIVDALIANFTVPSPPVYDVEKIARVIQDAADRSEDRHPGQTRAEWYAAALISALPTLTKNGDV